MKIAILLANMGGPDSLEAVEPFLLEIFRDPDIIDIPLPEFLRLPLVRYLAKKRAPESKEIYQKIGGKTPLLEITRAQALQLQMALNQNAEHQFQVFPAMRYWHPSLKEAWQTVMNRGFDRIVVLSMYPFYSTTTSGSIKNELDRLMETYQTPPEKVLYIDRFGTHPQFIQAIVEQIQQSLKGVKNGETIHILFSAHSIPMKRINQGDPYFNEVKQAVDTLREYFPEDTIKFHLSFQSKIGPIEWLSPSTSDKIKELASQGVKKLLVYPLGFVAENSETVYEIGMLYQQMALKLGIEEFMRIESLNTRPSFILALKQIVLESLT